MPLQIRLWRAGWLAVALFALSGCYTPYPGMYPPPGGNGYRPMMVPQSTFVMPGDVAGSPSSMSPVQSEFVPSSDLGAPEPVVPSSSSSGSVQDNTVPTPRDLDGAANPGQPDQRTSEKPLTNPVEGAFLDRPQSGDFREPIIVASTPTSGTPALLTTSATGNSIPAVSRGGFTHDPEYRWFQGIVEYDGRSRTWHLVYDGAPAITDRLGGEVMLTGNFALQPQDSGHAFHVVGHFDDKQIDQLGKSVYRVTRVERLGQQPQ